MYMHLRSTAASLAGTSFPTSSPSRTMANSRYEHVKQFELSDQLLLGCWIVIRLDGKGFTKFCDAHHFDKPNDARGLNLMNAAAADVMTAFPDIRLAYGESDEYSFVFDKDTTIYSRRASKLISLVVSTFTASYVKRWSTFFPDTTLLQLPVFDARAVCYPSDQLLKDYIAWRQVDTHVNNQYNTCFWALRQQGGKTAQEAQAILKGTQTDFKNELLFQQFGINYNALPEQFKKGSVVVWEKAVDPAGTEGGRKAQKRRTLVVKHVDVIKSKFWDDHPNILE